MGTDLKLSRFLRTEEDDADTSWEARIAKKYYDKLFKEYCIADLSRYKEGKVAMRWRTQKEVVEGRGTVARSEIAVPQTSCPLTRLSMFAARSIHMRINPLHIITNSPFLGSKVRLP